MFKLKYNNEIGEYLSELIDTKYPSKRQFCIAYLKLADESTDPDTIRKMANRLSQIIKGTKAIQTYDLPFFTHLLGISCEQILSAGDYIAPIINRMTNYSIALSKNPEEWEEYIHRDDKLILNSDEYGNTVLDYALEFGNYDLIQYLLEKNYIWFDSRKNNEYIKTFGAGTSIKRREFIHTDSALSTQLALEDKLRLDLISLAVDHNDINMLNKLRARENPRMYFQAFYFSFTHPEFQEDYNKNMVKHISKSSFEILDYFTDEFEISDRFKNSNDMGGKHIFVFPYISQLLDLLIKNKSKFAETALKKAIKHNQSTYIKLCELIEQLKNDKQFSNEYMKDCWSKCCQDGLMFSDESKTVSFYGLYTSPNTDKHYYNGLITNIACTTQESDNPIIMHLIEELKDSYNSISTLKDHLEDL